MKRYQITVARDSYILPGEPIGEAMAGWEESFAAFRRIQDEVRRSEVATEGAVVPGQIAHFAVIGDDSRIYRLERYRDPELRKSA